jgi:epidermal growth factor receptor substrate 15
LILGPPNLNLTPEERRVFGQLFRQADTENIGVVTGEAAVKFFEKTRLEPRILGEVCLLRQPSQIVSEWMDDAQF